METVRDIVIIVFVVTGTITAAVLLILGIKLYLRTSQALNRIGRVADDLHGAAQGAQSGVNIAKGAIDIVAGFIPGTRSLKPVYKGAIALARAIRIASRFKRN